MTAAGLNVLIVEDDYDNAAALEMALAAEGARRHDRQDGREALNLLETAETLLDAVLLDLVLPDLDGWELARIVRESPRLHGLPIIILSAVQPRARKRGARLRTLGSP